jgi:hypothetical protein
MRLGRRRRTLGRRSKPTKEITMRKALIIALALTSVAALATPAFAHKKCRSMLSHCLYKSKYCSDMKDCQLDCLYDYNNCTMSHDMSSSTPLEKM